MEEPINKRLFEKCLKDESGLKDPSSDWEMSQSSVSNTVRSFSDISKNCPRERANINHLLLLQYDCLKIVGLPTYLIFPTRKDFKTFLSHQLEVVIVSSDA